MSSDTHSIPYAKSRTVLYVFISNPYFKFSLRIFCESLRKPATIKVIEGTGADDDGICVEYIGEYPADEDVPEPPYHTNCECFLYYVEVDDEDDIHDLDLELEE